MKRLTREERRRLQRRSANIRFVAFILVLLAIGATIGYAAGRAQATQEPRTGSEVSPRIPCHLKRPWRPQRTLQKTIQASMGWN